jgi:hypothetical protein
MHQSLLKFSQANAKLQYQSVVIFNIPAGHTCPGAKECLARYDRRTHKIVDGPEQRYRCYAASTEWRPTVRNLVDHNFELLKKAGTREAMGDLITLSMPGPSVEKIRIHSHGDFFSEAYFLAWMDVARNDPNRRFYAYTKSLVYWVRNKEAIPPNMVLTASRGGKFDFLIDAHKLREAVVVYHPEDAEKLGLEIDDDDSHAQRDDGKNFALLIHGGQPKDTPQGEALKRLKREEIDFSYSRK